ncbi:mediator of RNA polymerase II transcription subunit 15-like [Eriocheir sinensis]|uniref:mediator of RNA polymerase II transcription subunit 15-like n=1 Tax=Eriocheir sinensis TaxID=95602 RepID=UPI0021C6D1E9|nr:mediator of RNA polymerase II transcription subunit 15-like [Eriocheir sinensis]
MPELREKAPRVEPAVSGATQEHQQQRQQQQHRRRQQQQQQGPCGRPQQQGARRFAPAPQPTMPAWGINRPSLGNPTQHGVWSGGRKQPAGSSPAPANASPSTLHPPPLTPRPQKRRDRRRGHRTQPSGDPPTEEPSAQRIAPPQDRPTNNTARGDSDTTLSEETRTVLNTILVRVV